MTEQTVRCERCERPYPADLPGCPNCLAIRRTNKLILTTVIALAVFTIAGWLIAGTMM